jgi:hypothetical protein
LNIKELYTGNDFAKERRIIFSGGNMFNSIKSMAASINVRVVEFLHYVRGRQQRKQKDLLQLALLSGSVKRIK